MSRNNEHNLKRLIFQYVLQRLEPYRAMDKKLGPEIKYCLKVNNEISGQHGTANSYLYELFCSKHVAIRHEI